MKHIAFSFILTVLLLCSCGSKITKESQSEITAEMTYEGVSNYCHSAYDWSVAEANPDIMYVEMGEETDSTYLVVFRSYTGTFVNFYVNKASGTTRMEEYVPTLSRDCHDVPLLAKKRHRHKAMSSFGCPDGLEPSTFRTTI